SVLRASALGPPFLASRSIAIRSRNAGNPLYLDEFTKNIGRGEGVNASPKRSNHGAPYAPPWLWDHPAAHPDKAGSSGRPRPCGSSDEQLQPDKKPRPDFPGQPV